MSGTIYEAAGGAPAFLALATAHHARCLADPVLEHPFSHGVRPDHIARLGAYWAEVLGGPPAFSERGGEQAPVIGLHAGTGADDELGERFLACFLAAVDDAELPTDPALRAALRDYMTWAVAEVMSYAHEDAPVPASASMPRWGWHGLDTTPS